MDPIELLEKELAKYEKNVTKSSQSFKEGKIDFGTHQMHIENNAPIITRYKYILRIIKTYE